MLSSTWLGSPEGRRLLRLGLVVALPLAAALLGYYPSQLVLFGLVAVAGVVLLLRRPIYGLAGLIVSALVLRLEVGTGTEVRLNLASLIVPALVGLWLFDGLRLGSLYLPHSRVNRPLCYFLLSGILSLLVGNALWDPAVPRPANMTLVQLAQWALFAFSASAFWLTGSLARDERRLRQTTAVFVCLAGMLAILRGLFGPSVVYRFATFAVDRSPFWMLLAALAGGQLLFNAQLGRLQRGFLLATLGVVLYYALVLERKTASNWIGVLAVSGVLLWLRFPRWRRAVVVLALVLAPVLWQWGYQFAGGEDEWEESGGSRLVLIGRVLQVSLRNPLTGLGPASYRPYTALEPLQYGRALWIDPKINSHNNYADLFAHQGVLGLGLFFWFVGELGSLGWRLSQRFRDGFVAGYVNAMLAALVGSLALMAFADWILPFVYNIGFDGFQASALVWLFLGGLISIEQWARVEALG